MTRKRAKPRKDADAAKELAGTVVKEPAATAPSEPTPIQRPASPDEAQKMQAKLAQQRGRAEVAVLKQRFAETDVAMTIAQAEVSQLVQQNQALLQENERLKGELAAATDVDSDKQPGDPDSEADKDDGQMTAPESED